MSTRKSSETGSSTAKVKTSLKEVNDSTTTQSVTVCRICHSESGTELITPCLCSGTLRFVHQSCIQRWIRCSNVDRCELCRFKFIMKTKTKPFHKWSNLDMSGFERTKLLSALLFHALAFGLIVWTVWFLVNEILKEIQIGLHWTLWTVFLFVFLVILGSLSFMCYICKHYLILFQRWKASNRIFTVENAPIQKIDKEIFT